MRKVISTGLAGLGALALVMAAAGLPAAADTVEGLTTENWMAAINGDAEAVALVEEALDAEAGEQTSSEATEIAAAGYAWVRFDLGTLEPTVAIPYPAEVVAALPAPSDEELSTGEIFAALSDTASSGASAESSHMSALAASCTDNADARIRFRVATKEGCRAWEGTVTQTVTLAGHYAYAGDHRTGFRITGTGTLVLEAGTSSTWPFGTDVPFNRVSR